MLVADTFDAMAAEAVLEDGRALEGFTNAELQARIELLQAVAGGHGAGGTGGEAGACKAVARALDSLIEVGQRVAGDIVVPQRVAHLFELVEDHVLRIMLELVGLVEDLLDVGLAARRCDDFRTDGVQPVKALLAHLGRENGDALRAEQAGVERAAAAVVAGGGPDSLMLVDVELAGDESRSEAAERSADLMAAGGEPLAGHRDDAAGHAGQNGRDLNVVRDGLEQRALDLGLVLPRDAEQIQRVDIPHADGLQLFLNFFGNGLRMLHLRDGRDDDAVFLGLLDIMRKALFVDGQIDFTHCQAPPVLLVSK